MRQKSKQQVSSCEKCTWCGPLASGVKSQSIWICEAGSALGLFDHLCLEPDRNSFIFMSAVDESCECADGVLPPPLLFLRGKTAVYVVPSNLLVYFESRNKLTDQNVGG